MRYLLIGLVVIFMLSGCEDKPTKADVASKSEVLAKIGSEPMVLEIGASSCTACIDMKKKIDALKSQNTELPIYIVDVYENKKVVDMFKIQMIPTQVVLNSKGKEVHRNVGGVSSEKLLEFVDMAKE
ncbi:MAG: thioredoxin family protein [Campylobacterales bacterium]